MEFKIKLKIKDVEIDSLNLDELRELKNLLDDLLNAKKEVVKEKEYILYPMIYPTIPYYDEPYYKRYPYWEVTWYNSDYKNTDGTITYSDSNKII